MNHATPQSTAERLNALDLEAATILAAPAKFSAADREWAREHATVRKMLADFTRRAEPCQ